ncbi:hypothetical protein GCM10007867_31800 [Gluconobacter cerinus]|uniref:Uncharacterized protein n=1 Tax=Gluconobacter cerinus TaxID=38307 RepID=A0AAV5NK23_9PROT|nr:hypothetical protein GCM10007867_31800 [Gluconobacter cerinus]
MPGMRRKQQVRLRPHVRSQSVALRFSETDVFMACEDRLLSITTNITSIPPKMRGMCQQPSAITPFVSVGRRGNSRPVSLEKVING